MGLFRRSPRLAPNHEQTDSGFESMPISAITAREAVTIVGQVLGIRIRPSDELPTLVVRLGDETGSVTLVWNGRGAVGGVSLGRRLRVTGTPVRTNDGLCIFNPVYTLLA